MFVHVFGGQRLLSDVFLDLSSHLLCVKAGSLLNPEPEDLVNQSCELALGIPVCFLHAEIRDRFSCLPPAFTWVLGS